MWIRMNDYEIERDKKDRKRKYQSFKQPLICSFIAFFITSIIAITGSGKNIANPISLEVFFFRWMPDISLLALFLFLILYAWQLFTKRPLFSSGITLICPKCEKVKLLDGKFSCKCGGKFEYLYDMKWVKDDKKY